MIFAVFLILVIGVVAFFHFTQGFFSATISAILAAVAALLAVSYHEVIVEKFLGGMMANYAHAMVLLILFALIYLIPRLAFDSLVPGNLRLPAMVDKVGAGVMGLVAGLFAAGVVALAA